MAVPKVVQIFATSNYGDDGLVETIFALLEDGSIVYTGLGGNSKAPGIHEWNYLPPIPSREEAEAGES